MTLYYFVYVERQETPILIGVLTDEDKAYDLMRGQKEKEKWVSRVKTDEDGHLV
jgi:hypothetical protein